MVPQIIFLILSGISLGAAIARDGEPRPHYCCVREFFGLLLINGLLCWGGFYDGILGRF